MSDEKNKAVAGVVVEPNAFGGYPTRAIGVMSDGSRVIVGGGGKVSVGVSDGRPTFFPGSGGGAATSGTHEPEPTAYGVGHGRQTGFGDPEQPRVSPVPPRDDTIFMISYALQKCRPKFATLAKTHNTDEAAKAVAKEIIAHLERCGFGIVRVKPPAVAPDTHPKQPKP